MRSSESSPQGIIIKKRSSSGCLIVKKKNNGIISSYSDNNNRSNLLEHRKRSRLLITSDDSNTRRYRNVEESRFGSNKSEFESSDMFTNDSDTRRYRNANERLFGLHKSNFESSNKFSDDLNTRRYRNVDESRFGLNKRNRLDDDDELLAMRMRSVDTRSREYGSSSKDLGIEKRRKMYLDGYRTNDGPIRVQGKNGVLKVMVNKQFKGLVSKGEETGKIRVAIKNEQKALPPVRVNGLKLPMKSKGEEEEGSEDSDASERLEKRIIRPHGGGKSLHETPAGKVKRGSGTEKQRLRERIRVMLLEAGWTIDYRPRRNRDYLDAVYISPRGTAYWSIIKAYEALLKQVNSGETVAKVCEDSSAITLISDEILSQLTRKTKRKMELDMKRQEQYGSDSDGKATIVRKLSAVRNEVGSGDRYVRKEKRSSSLEMVAMSVKNEVNDREDSLGTSSKSESPLRHQVEKSTGSSSHRVDGGKSSKHGRSTLSVRRSSESDGFVPSVEKRTVLGWLVDSGTIQLNEKVMYMNQQRSRIMLEGWITRDGIHCGCCSKILSVSKFEIHAGSKLQQPFQNIFLDSGVSLLQSQINAWDKQKGGGHIGFCSVDVIADDPNDDACGICGDGGDLVCCDGCPSTFHQRCLDIQIFPLGDWHCPNCTCKFCRAAVEDVSRTVGENICKMCEKKYHKSCMLEASITPNDTTEPIISFCGKTCKALSEGVKKYVCVKHELDAGFSWSLVNRECTDSELCLSEHSHIAESNAKLAVSLTVMDECFLPIIDRRSGVNILRNVLYNCGSNFNRLNFGGFYTAILEKGNEIVASASIRFHGNRLAEMPFIGTRHVYRNQGLCRRLFSVVESALRDLKVKLLVIPATADFSHVWISKFGFRHIGDSLKKEIRSMNLLAFPGINMLQKELLAPRHADSSADTECNPCVEGIDTTVKNNEEVSVLEKTSPSGDKMILDYVAEHQPNVDLNSTFDDGYPKMEETEFKASTMAGLDTEKLMECKTSYNPFDEEGENEEDHSLMESPPQRNSDMAFLDHIIRSPVDTGETENGVVYSSEDDDDDDSPARQ